MQAAWGQWPGTSPQTPASVTSFPQAPTIAYTSPAASTTSVPTSDAAAQYQMNFAYLGAQNAGQGWAQLTQQQQWQQWEQWQQQYAQWHQQYGEKYQAQMGAAGAALVPPLPVVAPVQPPLPCGVQSVTGVSTSTPVKPHEPDKTHDHKEDVKKSKNEKPKGKPETLQELIEAEKAFDEQFKNWESEFIKWKEQNSNHPDKVQYREYEQKWEAWREQLLQKRANMRKKREQKEAEEAEAAAAAAASAAAIAAKTNMHSAVDPSTMYSQYYQQNMANQFVHQQPSVSQPATYSSLFAAYNMPFSHQAQQPVSASAPPYFSQTLTTPQKPEDSAGKQGLPYSSIANNASNRGFTGGAQSGQGVGQSNVPSSGSQPSSLFSTYSQSYGKSSYSFGDTPSSLPPSKSVSGYGTATSNTGSFGSTYQQQNTSFNVPPPDRGGVGPARFDKNGPGSQFKSGNQNKYPEDRYAKYLEDEYDDSRFRDPADEPQSSQSRFDSSGNYGKGCYSSPYKKDNLDIRQRGPDFGYGRGGPPPQFGPRGSPRPFPPPRPEFNAGGFRGPRFGGTGSQRFDSPPDRFGPREYLPPPAGPQSKIGGGPGPVTQFSNSSPFKRPLDQVQSSMNDDPAQASKKPSTMRPLMDVSITPPQIMRAREPEPFKASEPLKVQEPLKAPGSLAPPRKPEPQAPVLQNFGPANIWEYNHQNGKGVSGNGIQMDYVFDYNHGRFRKDNAVENKVAAKNDAAWNGEPWDKQPREQREGPLPPREKRDIKKTDEAESSNAVSREISVVEKMEKNFNERLLETRKEPSSFAPKIASERQVRKTVLIEDLLCPPGRSNRPQKMVIVLRGPPGSGKTYASKLVKDKEVQMGGSAPRILSLDDYFTVETDKEEVDAKSGRKYTMKVMEYVYEEKMAARYHESLIKTFKRTVSDGFFPFIVIDCINDKVNQYEEMYTFAQIHGFQVYVAEMDMDVVVCSKRNIHNRAEKEILDMVENWEPTPSSHTIVDMRSLLQSAAITEVDMEDVNHEESKIEKVTEDGNNEQKEGEKDEKETKEENKEGGMPEEEEEEQKEFHPAISKWEVMDTEERLDRLDGIRKIKTSTTIKEWLEESDDGDLAWYTTRKASVTKKKTVKWADLEEKMAQERMREIGFVVGHTDWNRIMDPTLGGSKLTQTKYI